MEKTFMVGGMACENCVKAVTDAISAVPGVQKVDVSLADQCAKVTYDGKASDKEFIDAIEYMGYDFLGLK